MPIFRAFPRVGLPPKYRSWDDYAQRIDFMVRSKVMSDYTLLWYDVRPHPDLGTVEVRAMDSQTRIEHTLGIAALVQAMVKELCEHFDTGEELADFPYEMLDENRWLAARKGLDGELVDLPSDARVPTRDLARRVVDRLRGHAEDLGAEAELEGVEDLLRSGTGASRQIKVHEANNDLLEVVQEIVEQTAP
jgi:carboxylate-amine ligase